MTGAHRPSVVQPADKLSLTETNDLRTHESFADYISRWDAHGEYGWWEGGNQTVAYRHQEGANVMYFDGHVSREDKENVWFPDEGRKRNRLWEVYNKH
jgi:prepilin-type processing-associated H-X9-DG protein